MSLAPLTFRSIKLCTATVQLRACCVGGLAFIYISKLNHCRWTPGCLAFNELRQRFSNCGPRKTSGPRGLLLWSFYIEHQSKKDRKNKINVNCVSNTIVGNLEQSLEITYNKRLSLSLPGLTFYEIYYPTYSTLNNKRGIFLLQKHVSNTV